nr:protein kinase-like domain, phloem protein 2-like protein [Tanacetum cinerariifolium]
MMIHADDLVHLEIPLQNILEATNNFDDENNIGRGEFQNDYKGNLLWSVLLNDDLEPKLYYFDFSIKIEASQRHLSFQTNRVVYENWKSIDEHPDNKYLGLVVVFHYKNKILDEIMDPVLWKQMGQQSFNVFAQTTYDCLNEERSQRPDIGEVVTRLKETLKLQMQRQNDEHSIVAVEVEVTSSNHDK